MTNHERYRRAAELVQPVPERSIIDYVEAKTMKKRKPLKVFATVCAAVALVLALTAGVYAADVGGIRHTMNIWLHGDAVEVTIKQVGEGQFEITYPYGSVRAAGGLAEDGRGGMRGVTEEEIREEIISSPDAEQDEDGRIWLYLRDHKIDVTDQIAQNGYAQVKVKDGLLADYITLIWEGDTGYSVSTGHFGYPSVESLRSGASS